MLWKKFDVRMCVTAQVRGPEFAPRRPVQKTPDIGASYFLY